MKDLHTYRQNPLWVMPLGEMGVIPRLRIKVCRRVFFKEG